MQQVKLLVGVKQIVIFATLVVRFQHVEKSVYIKSFSRTFFSSSTLRYSVPTNS